MCLNFISAMLLKRKNNIAGGYSIMNGTLCRTNQVSETPAPEDFFATAPMRALRLEFDWQREEEVYTSFEVAISDRVLALQERHISMSERAGARARGNVTPAMDMLVGMAVAGWHKVSSARVWQRGLLLAGTALMLMLAGFDLMGWLVLHAR
jgi:hypothetical protein